MTEWFGSEQVVLALITQVGIVLASIVTAIGGVMVVILNRTRQHARAARVQVENSHSTNFREEQDEYHHAQLAAVASLRTHFDTQINGVRSDFRGMRKDIGRLADADKDHDERLRDLERTQPHPPKE